MKLYQTGIWYRLFALLPTASLLLTAYGSSEDAGRNWRVVQSYPPLRYVTYGKSLFVAVGKEGTIITSQDGVNWEKQKSGTSASLKGSVAYLVG